MDLERDLLGFMPRFNYKTIIDIEYALMKYRGLQPNPRLSSLRFFHYNNLLNKDHADNNLDPFSLTRGLKVGANK